MSLTDIAIKHDLQGIPTHRRWQVAGWKSGAKGENLAKEHYVLLRSKGIARETLQALFFGLRGQLFES